MSPTNADPLLEVTGLTKRFRGLVALQDVSFVLLRGQLKALIGPNGAGKSTLIHAISGTVPADGGTVRFRGQDISRLPAHAIVSRGIARTFQLTRLLTMGGATVLDNLLLGAHRHLQPSLWKVVARRGELRAAEARTRERAMLWLERIGLADRADDLPTTLPLASQKFLEIARALMTDPELLLLDEPAAGLNDSEVKRLVQLMTEIRAQGASILLVEHNMRMVMSVADEIVVLNHGKWLAEGTPASIAANPHVIDAYLGSSLPATRALQHA